MSKIVLTTAEVNAGWTFVNAELSSNSFVINLIDDLGRHKRIEYLGTAGETLLAALNKGDFSGLNLSLIDTLLQKIIDDGHIEGTLSL